MPYKNIESLRRYRREWYYRNKEHAKNKVIERKAKNRQWLKDYKSQVICKYCGENDPVCLDFHHRDPSKKTALISQMVYIKGWSIERMLEEINKCDIVCSNCHRKIHALGSGTRRVSKTP